MDATSAPFDRRLVRHRRERAAAGFGRVDFLVREVAKRLLDRLDDIRRDFPIALDLGGHDGQIDALRGTCGGIQTLVRCDLAPAMAASGGGLRLAADEEALPFAAGVFDVVLSAFSLHWVNDLPGTLMQIRGVLKNDGLFLAAMPGGRSLWQLREVLRDAEVEIEGGLSPRVSPFADLRDLGALLQRAGFALPVVDADHIDVTYATPLHLMHELRQMGETNALRARRRTPMRRTTLLRAASLYQERYGDADGRIPASFEILYLTAWKPDASQQQPLVRGSAADSLVKALRRSDPATG